MLPLLSIKHLKARTTDKEILQGVDLEINHGEVHVIMGPNGAGKSTLASVLAGHPRYTITAGYMHYEGKDLLAMPPEIRAREGLFLSFQYPAEVPGLSNMTFIKTAINERRKHLGLDTIDAMDFNEMLTAKAESLQIDQNFIKRSVNEGFSGGEKKRNEIFQLAMLEPKLAILDEIDSGLDVDALRIVAEGINKIRSQSTAFIIITHYQRLLDYITPDFIHVLYRGKIVKSGDKTLALEIEQEGYDFAKI